MAIAKSKVLRNHSIGEVGLLINLDTTAELDLSSSKLDFDAPPSGWFFYGLTGQDTKLTTDVQMFESKVGVPEFTIKRFMVGVDGTVTGNFLEADREIHDLIAGDGNVVNLGPTLPAEISIVSVDTVNHTIDIANADAAALTVGDVLTVAPLADLTESLQCATLTAMATGALNTTLSFTDGWFPEDPVNTDVIQVYYYGIAQIGASQAKELQAMLVYETRENVQFIYHFPKVTFTPNISPSFSSTNEVYKLPFEFKIIGVDNDQHFDGDIKILGYFYELFYRSAT